MDVKGTPIDEFLRLARHYGLGARIQDMTVEGLAAFSLREVCPSPSSTVPFSI